MKEKSIYIPGSKSISHRFLICASLSNGKSKIKNLLKSEDIFYTISGLKKMGAEIKEKNKIFKVQGFNGKPQSYSNPIYLGNSGTSVRFLTGVATLGNSEYTFTGNKRMKKRPIKELIKAFISAGIHAKFQQKKGFLPITIKGTGNKISKISINCSSTSQYLSSILMISVFLNGVLISLPHPSISAPYVDLTIDIMKKFNVIAEKKNDCEYYIPSGQKYFPGEFTVEPDISNASYFWAAGALTGKKIRVKNISKNSLQGDIKFLDILTNMGCFVEYNIKGISVVGKSLKAVDVDMSDIPDIVPTLAILAAFAKGETFIRNISHVRKKECDRIKVIISQLRKMGIKANQGRDWLSIKGGKPVGAFINTFNDHRIAMAFSIPSLIIPKIEIENPDCVIKSFPTFWQTFDKLN